MRRYILSFLLIICVLMVSCARKEIKPHKTELTHITILYFNDYHGHMLPFKAHFDDEHEVGGMARIATIVKEIKRENGENRVPTLFLCAGDVLQGTPMSTVFKGQPDFECLNEMGLNAMVLGNHEFDYGQENLNKLRNMAKFAILGANVLSERGQSPIVRSYYTRNLHGIKVHIMGLVTDDTPVTTHPRNVQNLVFADPIHTAKKVLKKLNKDDLIIALTHLGYEVDKELARSAQDIDIIIGGHSHTKLERPVKLGNTIICQAYEYGEFIGRLDLDIEEGKIARITGSLIPVTDEVEEDSTIKEIVDGYAAKLDESLKQVIGTAVTPLNGERESVRNEETNLGNLIADVMRDMGKADVAFINGGGIRASIDQGDITVEEVLTVLPYENHLVTLRLTGAEILTILKRHAGLEPGDGAFLQVSGLMMEIGDKKIESLSIAGMQVEMDKPYTVATNDFLAAGGDGYETFKNGRDYVDTGLLISDMVIDYIKTNKTIDAKTEGRITKN
jgi:5'-nucleotidase/UDP-sugar diphosphatase